jgi:hypothetical protein
MKIYLAKSNRCSPLDYMKVRSALSAKDVEILEHTGGNYSHNKLYTAEKLIVLPEKVGMPCTIGRGLYEQILAFGMNSREVYIVTNSISMMAVKVDEKKLTVRNPLDWTLYAQYDDQETPRTFISSLVPMQYDIIL